MVAVIELEGLAGVEKKADRRVRSAQTLRDYSGRSRNTLRSHFLSGGIFTVNDVKQSQREGKKRDDFQALIIFC